MPPTMLMNGDDEAGNGVAAHELRSTVHRAEEGAFLFEFAAAQLRGLVVDHAGGKIGIDRHLLAGDGVQREARANFGDTGGALGDDDEIDDHQDHEDDQADDEIAAHDELRKAADDIAGGVGSVVALARGSCAWWRC